MKANKTLISLLTVCLSYLQSISYVFANSQSSFLISHQSSKRQKDKGKQQIVFYFLQNLTFFKQVCLLSALSKDVKLYASMRSSFDHI